MFASPLYSHCAESMVLECLLHSMKVSTISRSDFFLVVLQRWNGLPMRLHRIECVIVIPICPECSCNHHFVLVGFLQHFVCFVKHALPQRWSMSGAMGRIQKKRSRGLTGRRIFPCSTVDFSVGCNAVAAGAVENASVLKKEQSGCILEEISHSSKCSVWPMQVINSFDFSLNGLNSSVLFKSFVNESRFGWFSNCWISLCAIALRFESSSWTVDWGIRWIL